MMTTKFNYGLESYIQCQYKANPRWPPPFNTRILAIIVGWLLSLITKIEKLIVSKLSYFIQVKLSSNKLYHMADVTITAMAG